MKNVQLIMLILFLSNIFPLMLHASSLLTNDEPEENSTSWYIAKLNQYTSKYDIINQELHQIRFTLMPGQIFLYLPKENIGYLKDGTQFRIPDSLVMKVGNEYFKFEYSKDKGLLSSADFDELEEVAKKNRIDLHSLLYQILNEDTLASKKDVKKAFAQFVKLYELTDGAAAEIYVHVFWEMINILNDKKLAMLLSELNPHNKRLFKELILDPFTTYPVMNPRQYLNLFYPKSLEILLK